MSEKLEPWLKWVGSKRAIMPQLAPFLPAPTRAATYVQPFMGAGTPFWQLFSGVRQAILSDANGRLVETYVAVRDHTEELMALCDEHTAKFSEDYFYEVREAVNSGRGSLIERAAWFIVINKWGFNGLWRMNPHGECNVSFCRKDKAPALYELANVRACSLALQGADVLHEDFATTLARATAGSFAYIDSPYHPASATADFTAYTPEGFSYPTGQVHLFGELTDHERLLVELRDLDARGVAWVLSNADVPEMRAAYAGWEIHEVLAPRSVNSDPTKRGAVSELVVQGRVRL